MAFTPLVRDLKHTYPRWQIFVVAGDAAVWANNPHIAGLVLPGDPEPDKIDLAVDVGPYRATQGSKNNGVHFMRAFEYGFTRVTGLPVATGPCKADLHLSEEELAYRPVAGCYWVLNADTNNMGAKRWPVDRWRALIRSMPQIRFVQVGRSEHCLADLGDEPNVTSLVGRTDVRQLFALASHAQGCVSLVSSLMHVAAAFDKPCVVLAGGREPHTFEQYPSHYYISRVGMLPCAKDLACWKNSITACKDQVQTPAGPVARCMTTISVADVRRGIELYYEGGRLAEGGKRDFIDRIDPIANEVNRVNPVPFSSSPPLLRIVTNGKCFGGAERSCARIAGMFRERNWQVEIATRQPMCPEMAAAFDAVAVRTDRISGPCDCLLWYASDQVYDAHLAEFEPLAKAAGAAKRKVMAITYKLGKVPDLPWCRDWDSYLFLSSVMAGAFVAHATCPVTRTAVLAPPVDLAPFLALQPTYDAPIRVVRHSSQGDNKWPPLTGPLVESCPNARFDFMPAPSWLPDLPNLTRRPHGEMEVPTFLACGNLFLYLLPEGYTDQGPRVVVEAMAAGLPVVCGRRDGCADRVTEDTGWFVSGHQETVELIRTVTPALLAVKGRAARERARTEFDPWNWYTAISGENHPSSIIDHQ